MTESVTHEMIYDLASKNAPPSVGMDILFNHHGFFLMDLWGDYPEELKSEEPDLVGLASLLAQEVLQLAKTIGLAPFDGTLKEFLEDNDTEHDWLVREDLLPFVTNWHMNVRGML